ncbi:MAG: rhodanese-like domain-containing protein [Flavisolibacter sp.]|nr:rhodanese-like domain-containing protein [Flavisolibacter sp.]MBD0350957.1 rhodanese-like domain-containing protein [Flavisolibacter sp.]MBD0365514.1 rhodanese-like domain-containing protein [Flavisolibacter sp.]MBD0377005.1 rhodanese-like domain-containing protein [Flavisolibacter sp.]
MKKNFLLLSLFLFFIATPGLLNNIQAQTAAKEETLSSKKFEKKMKKRNTVVMDVRTAEEYASGHIPKSLNMDVQQENFTNRIQSLDKSRTYLLYCRSGKRSAKALNIMKENGFDKVYHLEGGITAWNGAKE